MLYLAIAACFGTAFGLYAIGVYRAGRWLDDRRLPTSPVGMQEPTQNASMDRTDGNNILTCEGDAVNFR